MGLWFIFGLAAALGDAGMDVVTKRHFTSLPPYVMGTLRFLSALPFLAVVALFVSWPAPDHIFWQTVGLMLGLEVAATLLYMRALTVCHLSLCIPFLAFTPIFLLLTGWVFLGEMPNRWGLAGIVLVVGGSYILSLGSGQAGVLGPFQALAREPGARMILGVAAIYSVTGALFKVAVLHSEPLFMSVSYPSLLAVVMLAGSPIAAPGAWPWRLPPWVWVALLGFFLTLSTVSLAVGLELAPAVYLISVKRLSLLFSVLLGGLFLKERPFLPRLAGVILMCAGVMLISLKGA